MDYSAQSVFDQFFIFGELPPNMETGTYMVPLVILSYVIASLGSFTGLRLATDIHRAPRKNIKNLLHLGGAFAFGTGIWAMHFIGMLAYDLEMVHTYDFFLTFLSMIIAIGIAYGVLKIIRAGELTIPKFASGALLLGTAICTMHFVGMAAMQMDANIRYVPSLFILSVIIAITASAAALWIVFTLGRHDGQRKMLWQILAAMVMGAAICGMHYVGMAAAVFIPFADCRYDPDQEFSTLALVVSVVSSAIFAISIILSLFKDSKVLSREFSNTYSGNKVFLQLSILLSAFLLLLVGSYTFLIIDSEKQERNGIVMNAAGLQRTFILRYSHNISARLHKKAKIDEVFIETNFDSLLEGGELILSVDGSKKQNISAVDEAQIATNLVAAQAAWDRLKELAAQFSSGNSDIEKLDRQRTATLQAQDILVASVQKHLHDQTQSVATKQEIIIGLGFLVFILAVVYSRFFIANPIEKASADLKASRRDLAQRVQDQTKKMRSAKEEAERLNTQMQVYTDKLEEGRLEQMETTHKLEQEAKTIKLFEQVSTEINLADTIEDAMRISLNEICIYTGWSVGHAYIFDETEGWLASKKIWYLKDVERLQGFKEIMEATTFLPGEGLVGQVYESCKPTWIPDVTQDSSFPILSALEENVVRAAIGVPVLVKKEAVAVLEFYSEKVRELDDDLLRVMSNIAMQVGRIVERDQMQLARRAAESANQAKGEFLANMSHELRTPLNSIIGLSRMLADDAEEKSDERDMNRTVHKSASNLLEIVNDILDLSKIDAGETILESIGFDLKDVVAGVIETLAPISSAKGLSLNYTYKEKKVPYLKGDPVRVGRILTNIIGNAIKYTEKGGVDIAIDFNPVDLGKVEIECTVVDTGIGISEEKLPIIFQKFSQADETTTRKFGGTGLGLSITNELVELMGGTIGVKSTLGTGSTFWFKIPFDTADEVHDELRTKQTVVASSKRAGDRVAIDSAKILVAEDHELNQMFIRKLLGKLGFQHYDLVENGLLALKAVRENSYDLILMDCHMPEMNGYQATGEIRKLEEGTEVHVPIFALTADAMTGAREKCLEVGMDDFVTKPIHPDEFKALLEGWFVFPDEPGLLQGDDADGELKVDPSALHAYADTLEEMQIFCTTFFTKTEEAIEALRNQCVDGQNETWVEISHQIKGSSGMIGALELQDLCDEAQLMEASSKDEREAKLKEIEQSYFAARKFFEQHLIEEENRLKKSKN